MVECSTASRMKQIQVERSRARVESGKAMVEWSGVMYRQVVQWYMK